MKKIKLLLLLPFTLLLGGFICSQINNEPQICYATSAQDEADEFISYWQSEIRGKYPDICTISKEKYNEVYLKYIGLSKEAKYVVDKTIDIGTYTIKNSMSVLINKFSSQNKATSQTTFNKSTTLTIVIVVGVFGMTAICGFYFMKTKKVID